MGLIDVMASESWDVMVLSCTVRLWLDSARDASVIGVCTSPGSLSLFASWNPLPLEVIGFSCSSLYAFVKCVLKFSHVYPRGHSVSIHDNHLDTGCFKTQC